MFVFLAAAKGARVIAAGFGFRTLVGFRRLCGIVHVEGGVRLGAIVQFCASAGFSFSNLSGVKAFSMMKMAARMEGEGGQFDGAFAMGHG